MNILSARLLVLGIIALFLTAPFHQAWADSTIGRRNLQQFGYWGSALDYVNEQSSGDYINQVAGASNVVFVDGIDPVSLETSLPRISNKIREAQSLGLGVVLYVENQFFKFGSVYLYDDAQQRMAALWNGLGPLQSSVKAFYLFDEPYGTNLAATNGNQIWWPFVRDNLNYAAAQLKTLAPGIPSVVVFGAEEIHFSNFFTDQLIPASVSWIGFDCYRSEEQNPQSPRCFDDDVNQLLANFESAAASNGQMLVLVPDAFGPASPSVTDEYATLGRLHLYKDFAANSWYVAAIYPWIFQHVNDGNGNIAYSGAESLPNVKNEYQIYFDVLNNKAHCDSNQNLVYTNGSQWQKAPACAPICESGYLVYRDADGSFYARGQSCN